MRGVILSGLSLLATSCAWANPDNRPVWNAFEARFVPEHEGWFYAALPVTVPLGVGAVLVDTLVAHPLQVIDDALEDAGELWDPDDFEFDDKYYTEVVLVPFRVIGTPLAFAGSFVGRSLFDVPERLTDEERVARERRRAERRQERFAAWLAALPEQRRRSFPTIPEQWHESFAEPLRAALAGDAGTRRRLHVAMLGSGRARFGDYDATAGLRDPDPIVRHAVLEAFPEEELTAELVATLRADPVESIRLLLEERLR